MPTLRAEQIKKTKTIRRVYICDIEGVYRRLSTAKKCKQTIKHEFFAALASTNARRRNCKEKKKDDPSLAIDEKYINKMFLFF